jgi:hypothetical protein
MHQQHVMRRIVLSAAVVGLAVLTALGGGDGVHAEGNTTSDKGSKEAFQKECESNVIDGVQGTFLDSPKDNLTACFYGDKSKTVCDQNGNNCNHYDPPKSNQEPGSDSPFAGSTGEIIEILPIETAPKVEETVIGGGVVLEEVQIHTSETQTVAPGDQPLFADAGTATTAPVETPLLAAAETEDIAPAESQAAAPAEPGAQAPQTEVVEAPADIVETPAEEPAAAAPADVVETPAEESIPAASSQFVEIPAEAPAALTEEPVAVEEPLAAGASAEQP